MRSWLWFQPGAQVGPLQLWFKPAVLCVAGRARLHSLRMEPEPEPLPLLYGRLLPGIAGPRSEAPPRARRLLLVFLDRWDWLVLATVSFATNDFVDAVLCPGQVGQCVRAVVVLGSVCGQSLCMAAAVLGGESVSSCFPRLQCARPVVVLVMLGSVGTGKRDALCVVSYVHICLCVYIHIYIHIYIYIFIYIL